MKAYLPKKAGAMSKSLRISLLLGALILSLTSCTGQPSDQEPAPAQETAQQQEETSPEKQPEEQTVNGNDRWEELLAASEESIVRIKGDVESVEGNRMKIRSAHESYPGVFEVEVPEEVFSEKDLQEVKGSVLLKMKLPKEGEKYAVAQHLFTEKCVAPQGKYDVLYTAPPPIHLRDVLSSSSASFEVKSGSYQWSAEGEEVVACGVGPLDEQAASSYPVCTVPNYQKIDYVLYSLDAPVWPERAMLIEWSTDSIGKEDAKPLRVQAEYWEPSSFELRKDRVYELIGIWKQENFGGEASYIFRTE